MKPDPDVVLGALAQTLAVSVVPLVQPAYLAGQLGMTGMLLAALAEEWDKAADRLDQENRAIRALFRQAEGIGLPAAFAQELRALAGGEAEDLRVSTLERANAALREALIRLHAAVEERPDAAARALNEAIWAELSASTRRRALAADAF